jgi:tetratricopeptide (TPR) repeat protein
MAGNILLLIAIETDETVEALRETYEEELEMISTDVKLISERTLQIGETEALELKHKMKLQGMNVERISTLFSHQGILYRLDCIQVIGNIEREYQKIRDSIRFLRERTEWLEKYEGKPVRTCLAGGLVSFECNRPRWRETTFNGQKIGAFLETCDFQIIAGGAWFNVYLRKADGSLAVELNKLRNFLRSIYEKTEAEDVEETVGKHTHPGFRLKSDTGEQKRLTRGTVFLQGDLAVWVWQECLMSKARAVEKDWHAFLNGLRIRSLDDSEEPPAYPLKLEEEDWGHAVADAGLSVILAQAKRIIGPDEDEEPAAVSPDGKKILLTDDDGSAVISDVATGMRVPLEKEAPFDDAENVRWSSCGKKLAYLSGGQVILADVDSAYEHNTEINALSVAWEANNERLLLCRSRLKDAGRANFSCMNLALVNPQDRSEKMLLQYPLAAIRFPVVSPDGKSAAFVANRDRPRTKTGCGNLHLCALDGSGLRRLTRGNEWLRRPQWSADGGKIYFVGQSGDEDETLAPWDLRRFDLYVHSLADNKTINLTRSGYISDVWIAGEDAFLLVRHWKLPKEQRGLFRVSLRDLEQNAKERPAPQAMDKKNKQKNVAERLRRELNLNDPAQVVLDQMLLEKASKVWAAAVGETHGLALDFSLASLAHLDALAEDFHIRTGGDWTLHFALSAYYGETLRRAVGAQWRIRPSPFSLWRPVLSDQANACVNVVAPFSETYLRQNVRISTSASQETDGGRKIFLVYPPTDAKAVKDKETPKDYKKAWEDLDQGKIESALKHFAKELNRFPKNRELAEEALGVCAMAEDSKLAAQMIKDAAEAGNEVPELLIRHANNLADKEPEQALTYYRKAANARWPSAECFIKIGNLYSHKNRNDIAESCWRRAFKYADDRQKAELRRLLDHAEE